MQKREFPRRLIGLGAMALLVGGGQPLQAASVFNASAANFSCADDEAAVIASGAIGLSAGGATYYTGLHQAGGDNQNPVAAAFGAQSWCVDDYETTGADGRGEGLLSDQGRLYAVFSIDGAENPTEQDLRRFTADGWLSSYGSGGGPRVSVVLRLDPASGRVWQQDGAYQGTYLLSRLSSGETNTLEVKALALNAAGELEVDAQAYFTPLGVNGQPLELGADAESPFDYSVRLSGDLQTALAASVDTPCPECDDPPPPLPPTTGGTTPGVYSSPVGVPALGLWGLGLLTGLLGLLGMGLRRTR